MVRHWCIKALTVHHDVRQEAEFLLLSSVLSQRPFEWSSFLLWVPEELVVKIFWRLLSLVKKSQMNCSIWPQATFSNLPAAIFVKSQVLSVTRSHDENGRHQGGAAQAWSPGADQAGLPEPHLLQHHLLSHENIPILQHAGLWPAPQPSQSQSCFAASWRVYYHRMWNLWALMSAALTAGVCFSLSWNEPTATMRWPSPCWAPLLPAPAWRRLWPLEPSQTSLRAALALCLVGELHPEIHLQSSVTERRRERESGDRLDSQLLFTSEWRDHSCGRYFTELFRPLEGHNAALMLLAAAASSCFCQLSHR